MKTIFTFLKAACLLLLFNNRLTAQTTPLAANGRLQIINRQLCNESGTAIQLRGMSSHGLHWFPQCYTSGSMQALATDWGADVFRATMYVDEGGYTSDPAGLKAKVTQLVTWAEQYGMYCIIDWHILNPGDPTVHTAEAKDFFATMAQQFAGKKNVLYEICNEPNGVSWSTIKNYAEQVIPVIRQRDPNGIILVGTPNYSGTPWDVLGAPLTGSNAYNVMYTYHFYAGSHYLSSVRSNLENVLAQLPLFVSEWGTSNYTGNGGDDYNSAQIWLDFLAGGNSSGSKVSWANWNFADKSETSSALNPGACSSGSWNSTSTSGTWVKNHILNPADNFGPPTPSVVITSPANGATVATGSNVAINATVNNATASRVEFYNGSSKIGEDLTAPYSWTVTSITAGNYSFSAKAVLNNGSLTSAAVSVTASTANQPPTVALTSPAANATFTAPATVTLTATASDADGSVARVEFYSNGNKIGEDATAPYSFAWQNVAAGNYTLTAKAFDNGNAGGTSGSVTIIVNGTTPPPAASGISGPDCVMTNDVKTYQLGAADRVNATAYSWWVNGSTQSITPGSNGSAVINFGPYFTGGQLCVGVNYSASPWYKQFCKNVTLCSGARTTTATVLSVRRNDNELNDLAVQRFLFPTVSNGNFTFIPDKEIRSLTVLDVTGRQCFRSGGRGAGQVFVFGEGFTAGTYFVQVIYADNTWRTTKVVKTK